MSTHESGLFVAQRPGGCVVRVEGRGTLHESAALCAFLEQCFADPECEVVLDLSRCEYLDSTFLGGMVKLRGALGPEHARRLRLAAPSEECLALLERMRLRPLFAIAPAPASNEQAHWVELRSAPRFSPELSRHVLHCHRELASIEGPHQRIFAHIADQMERELRQPK